MAIVLVALVGVLARAPLARVPENTMKFAVGVMLTTFGIFWSAEGAGVDWPGGDAAILGVLAFVVLWSLTARLAAAPAACPVGGRVTASPRSAGSGGTSSSATTGWRPPVSRSRSS